MRIGRRYGQVCRRKLREHLVQQCAAAGVRFLAGEVSDVDATAAGASARVICSSGSAVQTRWATNFHMKSAYTPDDTTRTAAPAYLQHGCSTILQPQPQHTAALQCNRQQHSEIQRSVLQGGHHGGGRGGRQVPGV